MNEIQLAPQNLPPTIISGVSLERKVKKIETSFISRMLRKKHATHSYLGRDPFDVARPAPSTRRPLTAFMTFAGDMRTRIIEDLGDASPVEYGRELFKRWNNSSKQQKEIYEQRAERDLFMCLCVYVFMCNVM